MTIYGGKSVPSAPTSKYPVFLFVPDKVFNYRCQGCGLCCKGNGIQMDMEREGKTLLKRFPQLRYFFVRGERYEVYANLHDECWFYESDSGLCRIEREFGRSEKPWYCTLFPYDLLGVLNGRLLIGLHTSCPLSLDPRDGQVWLGNDDFMEQYDRLDLGHGTTYTPLKQPLLDLGKEAEILSWCANPDQAPDYLELAAAQAAIYSPGADKPALTERLGQYFRAWQTFFEDETDALDPALLHQANRHMTAITPVLRGRYMMQLEQLPLLLSALYFFARQSLAIRPSIVPKQLAAISSSIRIITAMCSFQQIPVLDASLTTPAAYLRKLPADLRPLLKRMDTLLVANATPRLTLLQILEQINFESVAQKVRLLNAVPATYMQIEFLGE